MIPDFSEDVLLACCPDFRLVVLQLQAKFMADETRAVDLDYLELDDAVSVGRFSKLIVFGRTSNKSLVQLVRRIASKNLGTVVFIYADALPDALASETKITFLPYDGQDPRAYARWLYKQVKIQ